MDGDLVVHLYDVHHEVSLRNNFQDVESPFSECSQQHEQEHIV